MGNNLLKEKSALRKEYYEKMHEECEENFLYQDFPKKNKYRAKRRALMKKGKDERYSLLCIFEAGPRRDNMQEHLKTLKGFKPRK